MLTVFPLIFVTGTKILFGYNFLAPLNYIILMLKFKQTNQSCSFSKISHSINVEWCTCDKNGQQFWSTLWSVVVQLLWRPYFGTMWVRYQLGVTVF